MQWVAILGGTALVALTAIGMVLIVRRSNHVPTIEELKQSLADAQQEGNSLQEYLDAKQALIEARSHNDDLRNSIEQAGRPKKADKPALKILRRRS